LIVIHLRSSQILLSARASETAELKGNTVSLIRACIDAFALLVRLVVVIDLAPWPDAISSVRWPAVQSKPDWLIIHLPNNPEQFWLPVRLWDNQMTSPHDWCLRDGANATILGVLTCLDIG
jgi:hypothetical protein